MARKKSICPSCGGELFLGQAHKCPLQQRAGVDWRWAAGIIFAIFIQIAVFIFGYGRLSEKVENQKEAIDDVEERLERIEKLYFRTPGGNQ